MKPVNKIVANYLTTINLVDWKERCEAIGKLLKDENISLRELSRKTNVPLTTLHEWYTRADLYRCKDVNLQVKKYAEKEVEEEVKAFKEHNGSYNEEQLRRTAQLHAKLRACLDLLKNINEIDTVIGKDFLLKIKQEIKRIEKR